MKSRLARQRKRGATMNGTANRPVLATPLGAPGGALGARRLSVLVGVILLLGAVVIFGGQRYLSSNDLWGATVTGVAKHTVNVHFDVGSDETEIAAYPSSMQLSEGDRVLVLVDEDDGNFVTKVLGR